MEHITAQEAREMLNKKVDFLLGKIYQGVLEQVRRGLNYYMFTLAVSSQYVELVLDQLVKDGYKVESDSHKEPTFVIYW
jgi:hypothetical protein